MSVQRIVTADDPRVALYRSVADPELTRTRALFVAEGRLVVRRALADPRYRITSLLLNDAAHRDLEAALRTLDGDDREQRRARQAAPRVFEVAEHEALDGSGCGSVDRHGRGATTMISGGCGT